MEKGTNLRRVLLLLLSFGFTVLIVTRFANIRQLFSTLITANLVWIIIAVVLHLVFFYINAVLHYFSFATVGLKTRPLELLPVLFASLFINAVVPTGGAGGAAIFVDYISQTGQQGARAAAGVVLALISDLVTLIPFVIYGMIYLLLHGALKFYLVIGVVIFLVYIAGLSSILVLALKKQEMLEDIFGWIQKTANGIGKRFSHPNLVSKEWADKNSGDFSAGAEAITEHPKMFSLALLTGIIMHVVNVAGLYAFFVAFHQPVQPGTLFAGFSLGIIFFVIAVIPQAVGAVEGIMSLVFILLGISNARAATIAFTFRWVNFWIPVIAGLISIGKVTSEEDRKVKQAES